MQKIGIGIGLDVSDLVANAQMAKNVIASLKQAVNSSIETNNIEDLKTYSPLYLEARKRFIQDARIGGYSDKAAPEVDTKERPAAIPEARKQLDQDAPQDSGDLQEIIKKIDEAMKQRITEGKSKEAEAYASVLAKFHNQLTTELVDSKNYQSEDVIRQAINSGDINTVHSQLDRRKQYVQESRIGGDFEIKLDSGPLETVIKELKDAINRSISEGKTEEAKKYGSLLKDFQKQLGFEQGDDERQKKLKETQQLRLMRNLTRFTNMQNVIGAAGAGNVAGAALGAAGGMGEFISQLPKGALIGTAVVGGLTALAAGANKLSEQWEKMMQPSMGLAASMGRLGDDARKNHAAFQEVFAQATDRRVLHGYSLEEGISLANQLSKSGMAADNVIGGEEQVFRYQRLTDADRDTLSRAVGYAGRYQNNENVLGYAFGGVKESGMQPGQYQEYLNATLRIFEEGLSKGVVKGFAEITRAQNMLAFLGDTWKGEQGAQRILQMEDAITGANGLKDDYDVIMWQAAQKQAEATGQKTDYLTISKILEKGISGNPDILKYVHEVMKSITDNGENREDGIMMYERAFGLKTTAAEQLWDALAGGKLDKAKAVFDDPSSKGVDDTPEGKLLSATESIQADVASIGAWFTGPKADIVDSISQLTNIMAGDKKFAASSVETMDVLSSIGLTGNRQININRAFKKAYTAADQPDLDDNGEGDYAQRAKKVQNELKTLPPSYAYYAAINPGNLINQSLDTLTGAEDFTAKNTDLILKRINSIKDELEGKSEADLKKEYLQNVASSVTEDRYTKDDDVLRHILTNYSGMIPNDPKIMEAFETARSATAPGGNGSAEISNSGYVKEVDSILTTLQILVPEFKDVAKALRESNEWIIKQEDG
jgi:hypothetical protein